MDQKEYTLEAVIEAVFGPTLGEMMHNDKEKEVQL